MTEVNWLPDDKYQKLLGVFRLQLNGVMMPFRIYGLDAHIPGAIDEIVALSELWCMAVRGMDKPISLDYVRRDYV